MSGLEQRLVAAADLFEFPESPDVVGRMRFGRRPSRRRPFAILAAAVLASAATVLALSPAARSGAGGWLSWVPGVEVERADTLQPFPLEAAPPYLGTAVPLSEARRQIGFDLRVPADRELGEPTVYVRNDVVGGIATLVYGDPIEPRLVLSQWVAANGTARYQVTGDGSSAQTHVDGRPALWIEGEARAVYTYLGADLERHQERLPVSANVLLWRDGAFAFRLEARTGLAEGRRIAESLSEPISLQGDARRALRRTTAPGVILFARVGTREAVAAAGFSTLRPRTRARGAERFWIGSVTKTLVATVVLQLVGEGRISLDDPVTRWLPEIPDGGGITVRRLLNHTSGLPDYFRVPQIARRLANPHVIIRAEELIRIAAAEPRDFEPGSSYGYSSTNYLVLGELVERATGRGIGAAIRERIVGKLGLARTTFGRPATSMRGYRNRQDVTTWTLGGPWADGAVWSDARGLARFFSVLLGGGLLNSAQLAEMLTKTPPSLMGLGIGGERARCGRTAWGHGGSTPGYETFALATRDGGTVVVAAANAGGHRVGHELFAAAERLFCRLTRRA